ncbi:general transcription factor IIE subunit 1-like [Lineus longissimus]|uniref:general transcription factor IIE subunit 1-like n=1 Tax=Lineus longissimus TaxID=88925 RepID=UPI002B4DD0A4
MEAGLLREVPESLKRLARYIVRGFYGVEHAIIIDLLVRNPCMKEDDLLELLKFDRKQLRVSITTLKNDKFLKSRMKIETDADGKNTKHNYYFINYKIFVNVVKYKLDHMRRKIETEERDSTSRASFKCPECEKSFTDLEVMELMDPMTGELRCTHCGSEVKEDGQAMPKTDARTLLAKFNEQIEPIYNLLRECEDFKLAPEILEPEPTNMKNVTSRAGSSRNVDHSVWSGDIRKNIGFGASENAVTVRMDDDEDSVAKESKPLKEQPIWMKESTVEGAISEPLKTAPQVKAGPSEASSRRDEDEITRILLVHEKKSAPQATRIHVPTGERDSDEGGSSTSESEDEIAAAIKTTVKAEAAVEVMESDDDDDGVPMVSIGDTKVPINEVSEEMVAKMTLSEKEAYIKLGQEMYADMYE